ncbi:MAG TPA: hypothetical protein VN857_04570 [Chthoniobacterales bacterium]|nr:hypothetical protein [Chthoniobacterales bacterium]
MSVDFPKPEDLDAREAELKTVFESIAAIRHKDDRASESPFDLIGRGLQLQHEIFRTHLGMILQEFDKLIAKEAERSAKIKEMEEVKARIQKLAARLAKPPV